MKGKSIYDSRSVKNISNKRLRIEVQPVQTNGVERVKRFVNVHLHCIVSNLKRISKISMLPPGQISADAHVLRQWRQNKRLPFQNLFILSLSWVTFLLVTVLWIVWTCDGCFFADFFMVRALLVKNYQIKLLKMLWYILLVLCTCFNSVSIQLETQQDILKY